MSETPTVTTVEHQGFSIDTNTGSKEQIVESFREHEKRNPEKDDVYEQDRVSEAASELGKKGGKAAAEKRAAKSKEKEPEEAKAKVESDDKDEKVEAKAERTEEAKPEEGAEAKTEEKPDEKKLGKPRDDPRARMLEATRKEAEAKRQLQAERQERQRERETQAKELQELKRQVEALARGERVEAPTDPDAEPKEENFETYAEYVKAISAHAVRQERKAMEEQAQIHGRAKTLTEGITRTVEGFNGLLAKAREADPEFDSKIDDSIMGLTPSFALPDGQYPQAVNIVADELISSSQAPALMLHFTEHPEEFQRVASLPNSRAIAREMAKLEERLSAVTAGNSDERPTKSKAAPPVRPVAGGSYTDEARHTPERAEKSTLDDYAKGWKPAARRR